MEGPEQAIRRGGGGTLDGVGHGSVLAGRYRLEERVRTRPDGSTWRAVDETLERPVLVQVFTRRHLKGAEIVDAARRAALVDDPRLQRVLAAGEERGTSYVVLERVPGQNLAQLLSSGPLPAEIARRIVGEAAEALDRAASRGLHHVRLRPTSVIIGREAQVTVSGTAIDAAADDEELASDSAARRADAVGLVLLLYTALTGRWPGPQDSALPRAPRVAGRPVPPADLVAGVPNDLDTLCTVTLGPHEDGPRSPGELVHQLAPWAPPGPLSDPRGLHLGLARPQPAHLRTTPPRGMPVPAGVSAASPRPGEPPAHRTPSWGLRAARFRAQVTARATPPGGTPRTAATDGDAVVRPGADRVIDVRDAERGDGHAAPEARRERARVASGGAHREGTPGGGVPLAEMPPPAGAPIASTAPPAGPPTLATPPRGGPLGPATPAALPAPAPASTQHVPARTAPARSTSPPASPPRSRSAPSPVTESTTKATESTTTKATESTTTKVTESTTTKVTGSTTRATETTKATETPTQDVPTRRRRARSLLRGQGRTGAESSTEVMPAVPEPAAAAPAAPAAPATWAERSRQAAAAHAPAHRARSAPPPPPRSAPDPVSGVEALDILGAAAQPVEPVAPFGPATPLTRPPREQSRLVLILLAVLVVLLGLFAVTRLVSFQAAPLITSGGGAAAPLPSPSGGAAGTSGAPSPSPSAGATGAVHVARATAIDPQGDNSENSALAKNAIDGNPGTSWHSERYDSPNFGGIKPGLGLVLDLGATRTVTAVTLSASGTDGTVELRTNDSGTYQGSQVVATGQVTGTGTVDLRPAAPVSARYLVVWFTRAPDTNGERRVVVNEVGIR